MPEIEGTPGIPHFQTVSALPWQIRTGLDAPVRRGTKICCYVTRLCFDFL